VVTVRQLVPGLFLLTLIVTSLLTPVLPVSAIGVTVGAAYFGTLLACVAAAVRRHGWRCALALAAVFPTVHFSYGLGSLHGVFDHLMQRRRVRRDPAVMPLSP